MKGEDCDYLTPTDIIDPKMYLKLQDNKGDRILGKHGNEMFGKIGQAEQELISPEWTSTYKTKLAAYLPLRNSSSQSCTNDVSRNSQLR